MDNQEDNTMISTKAHEELDLVKNDLRELRKDLKSMMSAMGNHQKDRLQSLWGRVGEETRQRMEQVRKGLGQAKDYGRDTAQRARHGLETRPWTAVLVALGVGALLGRLFPRR